MANDLPTIADFVSDALDLAPYELSEIRDAAPLMAALPAQASSDGTTHKYSVDTARPVVGFRAENAGRDFDHSTQAITTVTLKILDFSWAVDKAVADAWRQGGSSAYIAREGLQHIKAAMYKLEQQYIYGSSALGDSDGFTGLVNSGNLDAIADDMVVSAGGTTADEQTSVYFLRVSDRECSMVMRGDGVVLGDTVVQNMLDGSSKNFPSYYTPATTWVAGQIGSKYSAARLCNLHASDSGASLTDADIYSVLAKFPAGLGPNLIVMNKDAQEQLRASRTATNNTGAPAPIPDSTAGIAILTTDAVLNTEPVVS